MSGMPVSQESAHIYTGGQSQKVVVSTGSAQSTVINNSKTIYLCATVDCFIRQGANPTAVADSDQFLPAYSPMRYAGFVSGNKIAVIGTGAGALYITPEI